MASTFGLPREPICLSGCSSVDNSLARYVGAYMFKIFLYGLYTNLLIFGVYLLCINRRTFRWKNIIPVLCMFALATADIVLSAVFFFQNVVRGQQIPSIHPSPKLLFFITNNILAMSVITHRCYTVWRGKRCIVAFSSIFLVSLSVCGYIFAISSSRNLRPLLFVYLWMTFGLSFCLAVLTSGRIYCTARRASLVLGPDSPRQYFSIFAIIIDSGAIYPLYLLLDLTVKTVVLDTGLNQIVGIVPTLIICQRAFGRCTQHVNTFPQIRDEETSRSAPSTPVLDSIFSLAATALPDEQTFADGPSFQMNHAPSHPQGHDDNVSV